MMLILKIIFSLLGGCLYRWRGHASKYKKYFPRPFNQIVFAAPYAAITYLATGLWWAALIVLALTTLATLTGHGNHLDLGTMPEGKPETTEFLIKPFKSKLPSYWYDVLGMSMSGMLITASAGIATGNIPLILSGLLKGPAYMIGNKTTNDTALSEFLTGLFLYGALALL